MVAENKLSDKALKAMCGKPLERQKCIADGKGLSLRISRNGRISFVFSYRLGGRESSPVTLTLGKYPDMSLKLARAKRDQCRSWLADNRDPRIEMKITAEKTLRPVTIKEALDYWYENYACVKRKRHTDTIYRFKLHIYPKIGDIPLERSTIKTWLSVFDALGRKSPTMSAYIFLDVKQALQFCRVRQFAHSNVLSDLKVTDVGSFPEKRERVLSDEELKTVGKYLFNDELLNVENVHSCRLVPQIYIRRILLICLIFGCRLSEARLSHPSEWNFEDMLWIVPKEHSKNGKEIYRPIPEKALKFLKVFYEENKGNDYIIGRLDNQRNISTFVWRYNKVTFGGDNPWTLHDFRRTLSTRLNEMGADFFAIEQLLGHTIKGVSGIYNRSRYIQKKKEALDMWLTYIEGLINENSNVTFIRREAI
ncbi:DUF4102 domain-containing protein [Enterobacter sp. JMULE2]|uniref:tyrosine-type recombinase/integrase n=1 Tax=Enterobacter sp. JMULE2 TaxID=2518340 RepID=UPI0015763B52|nr:site-specific integrase [Enterobacter sp. JMULE2]NTZ36197.1 DUF4102 domain-containing protein [Enterobacter sp. JMULE2]NTZ39602.1 DUF4102 domain-containing protein [Enterobacter sp. JMULE2]